MTVLIGHSSLNVGRYSGLFAGGPNYVVRYRRWETPRLLYHSGLDELIEYPQVPSETTNFALDMLSRADVVHEKTLTNNMTQQWDVVHADTIIKEIFSGDLSQKWAFMHKVYRFWTTLMNPGDFCLWRPLERTDKVYRVRVVNMLINGEEFKPDYTGISMTEKWLRATLEIHLKLMPAFPPSATIFASGGLASSATGSSTTWSSGTGTGT